MYFLLYVHLLFWKFLQVLSLGSDHDVCRTCLLVFEASVSITFIFFSFGEKGPAILIAVVINLIWNSVLWEKRTEYSDLFIPMFVNTRFYTRPKIFWLLINTYRCSEIKSALAWWRHSWKLQLSVLVIFKTCGL